MKTIKYFAAALAIVAAASCSKEPIPNDNSDNTEPVLVHKVFTASLETDSDPDSKTTLHTDGKSVHWTAGDQIKVIANDGRAYKGTLLSIVENSIKDDFASFSGGVYEANSYRAIYPASSYDEANLNTFADRYCFVANTLANQYAVENDFSQTSFGCSNIAISTTSDNEHFYFQNINAILQFQIGDEGVYSVVVSSSKATSGSDGTLGEKGLGAVLNYKPSKNVSWVSDGTTSITFKCKDGSALSTGVDYYITIPAVTIEGLKLTFKDANGNVLFSNTKASSFTANPNTIYSLGTLSKPVLPDPKVGDYFYSDGTYGSEYNSNAVGIVFYVGDPTADDSYLKADYPSCTHGLVMDLEDEWSYRSSPEANFESILSWDRPDGYASVNPNDWTNFRNLSVGYALTRTVKKYSEVNNALLPTTGHEAVVLELNAKTNVSGTSGWYVPSCGEYDKIYAAIDVLTQSGVDHKLDVSRYYSTFWDASTGLYDGTLDGKNWNFRQWNDAGNDIGENWRYIFAF